LSSKGVFTSLTIDLKLFSVMVLTDKEFRQWCDRLKLPEQTREILTKVRTSEPVKKVKGTARNVHGPYASKKNGSNDSV